MKPKILVIEDDPALRNIYQSLLEIHGFEPRFSLNMQEIRDLIPQSNLVLSDYQMGLNFDEIAAFADERKIPFLAVTSIHNVHPNQLDKPFGISELLNKIAVVMKGN